MNIEFLENHFDPYIVVTVGLPNANWFEKKYFKVYRSPSLTKSNSFAHFVDDVSAHKNTQFFKVSDFTEIRVTFGDERVIVSIKELPFQNTNPSELHLSFDSLNQITQLKDMLNKLRVYWLCKSNKDYNKSF